MNLYTVACGVALAAAAAGAGAGCGDDRFSPRQFDSGDVHQTVATLLQFPSSEVPWMVELRESAFAWNDWGSALSLPLVLAPAHRPVGLLDYLDGGGSTKGFDQELMGFVRFIREGEFYRDRDTRWELSVAHQIQHYALGSYLWIAHHGSESDRAIFAQACANELESSLAPGGAPRFERISLLVAMLRKLDLGLASEVDSHAIEELLLEAQTESQGDIYWPIPGVADVVSTRETLGAVFLIQELRLSGQFRLSEVASTLLTKVDSSEAPFSAMLAVAMINDPTELPRSETR